MTKPNASLLAAENDRFCELAAIGASLAGAAIGQLLGAIVENRVPRICAATDPTPEERWCTGILFEAEGDLAGLVAIVMPRRDCDLVAARMLGRMRPDGSLLESALREFGNIIASQTVSAMADSLGATILLSIPTLVTEDAGVVLRSLIDRRGAKLRVEIDLHDRGGAVDALLVFAPDPPKKA
jgi:chemotaxis protein CheY-P-specific phosphatase CheC